MTKNYVIGIDEVGRGPLAGPVTVAAVAAPVNVKFKMQNAKLRDSKRLSEHQREAWFRHLKTNPLIMCAVSSVTPRVIDRINISRAANVAATRALRRLVTSHWSLATRVGEQDLNASRLSGANLTQIQGARSDVCPEAHERQVPRPRAGMKMGHIRPPLRGSSEMANFFVAPPRSSVPLHLRRRSLKLAHFRASQADSRSNPVLQVFLDGGLFVDSDSLAASGYRLVARTIVRGDERYRAIKLASIVAKVRRDRLMRRYHKKFPQYGFDRHKGYGTKAHYRALRKYGPSALHRLTFL